MMIPKSKFALALLVVTLPWVKSSAQESPPLTPNNLAVAQKFLRALYPELSDKNYFISLDTTLYYDKISDPFGGWLNLSIGEGPKDEVLYTVGGCLAYPAKPQPQGADSSHPLLTSGDCHPGPVMNKQYLSAGFHFDKHGRLVQFQARGSAIGNPEAKDSFAKSMESREIHENTARIELL